MFTKKLIAMHKRLGVAIKSNLDKLVIKRISDINETMRQNRLNIVSSVAIEREAVNQIAKQAALETLEARELFDKERKDLRLENNELDSELSELESEA